jgi:CDP-diacylglycerol--glycerol-3-phosphate 3-phosphatidyltransferase
MFDPLIDKILMGSAFIFLIPVQGSGMKPWMVAVIISREILVTGIRGYIEAQGKKFGADWFGKLKMVLQCVALTAILVVEICKNNLEMSEVMSEFESARNGVIAVMLVATIGSGVQYVWKAWQILLATDVRPMDMQ